MNGENLFEPNKIRTFTGKYINPLDPDPELICIEDIAHALSHIPRFSGHTKYFHSVAEHSLFVWRWCSGLSKDEQLAALLHDASEAYLLDIPAPVKAQISGYKEAENRMMQIVADKFGFKYPLSKEIKEADMIALRWEWEHDVLGSEFTKKGYSPKVARQMFHHRFNMLSK